MKSLLITEVNEKGKPKSYGNENSLKPINKYQEEKEEKAKKKEKKEKPSYFLVKNKKNTIKQKWI